MNIQYIRSYVCTANVSTYIALQRKVLGSHATKVSTLQVQALQRQKLTTVLFANLPMNIIKLDSTMHKKE